MKKNYTGMTVKMNLCNEDDTPAFELAGDIDHLEALISALRRSLNGFPIDPMERNARQSWHYNNTNTIINELSRVRLAIKGKEKP